MHAHIHMYERMYKLLNGQTPMHACTHTCMHACICTHTIIHLNLDMKSIKIKANDFYGKKNKYIHVILLQVSEVARKVFGYYIILPKIYLNLHTFIHMHYLNQSNRSTSNLKESKYII